MVTRHILRRRAIIALSSSAFAATVLYPTQTLYAEAPQASQPQHARKQQTRKPIYSDIPPKPTSPTLNPAPLPSTSDLHDPTTPSRPTPTDRLATQIRRARLFTYAHTAATETYLNSLFTTFLAHERSFTSTLRSLRPPPDAHENLLPGSLYILVTTMAGSILSRNRNILLRAGVPAAFGVGTAWVVLPATMRNVSQLVWEWEERVPVVAEGHMRVKGAVEEGWRWAEERGKGVWAWGKDSVEGLRDGVERWVKKGN